MRIILIYLAVIIWLSSCSGKAKEAAPVQQEASIPVKLTPIHSDTLSNTIKVSGLLATENEARLSFKTGGVIENITVKEGDRVKKGQLLALIKSTEIASQVAQVKLAMEKSERDYQRAQSLYNDSVATLEQLQNAKTGVDIARQHLQGAVFNQQYSKIYAPADGFIVRKLANAGELIQPGSPVLYMNASSAASRWILKAGLSDHEWAQVANGASARVVIEAFPGKTFPATVTKKSLSADANGSFAIELRIDLGKEQPALGMYGSASIRPSGIASAFSVPYEALLEANGSEGFVFVTDDRKTVKKLSVTITSIDNNVAYISGGLEGHAYIVTSGSPYLNENAAITVAP